MPLHSHEYGHLGYCYDLPVDSSFLENIRGCRMAWLCFERPCSQRGKQEPQAKLCTDLDILQCALQYIVSY